MLAAVATLALLALAACGGSTGGSGDTTAPTPTPTPAPATFLYFTNWTSLPGYRFDEGTGALSPVPTITLTDPIVGITAHPTGPYAYALNASARSIASYRADAFTGALSLIPGSASPTTPNYGFSVDPAGGFLYVQETSSSPTLRAFRLDSATGAILGEAAGSPAVLGSGGGLAQHPSGGSVYVLAGRESGIWGFNVDRSAGSIAAMPGSPFGGFEGTARSIVFHPSQPFAFVHEDYGIATVRINSSNRALQVVSREDTWNPPAALAMDPAGRYVFASVWPDSILSLAVDPSTGRLSSTGHDIYLAGGRFTSLFIHPSGRLLFVCRNVSDDAISPTLLGAYAIDSATGALSELAGSPFALADEIPHLEGRDAPIFSLGDGRWLVLAGYAYIHRFEVAMNPPAVRALERVSPSSSSVAVVHTGR
jgi:hypothetical protein